MYPNLLHIYGPLNINCYGVCIVLGILIFFNLIKRNPKFNKLITADQFKDTLFFSSVVGLIGGRILWTIEDWNSITNYYEIFALWTPGYASLGTILSILIFTPIYLKKISVPILPLLDLAAIYVPLLHSIARLGCFLAGCCHGIATNSAFGVTYTNPEVFVPEHLMFTKIHPTQLYSSFALLVIFLLMYFVFQNKVKKTGELLFIYLIISSIERFFNDFLRYNREFYDIPFLSYFSVDQLIALFIFLCSASTLIVLTKYNPKKLYST